MLNSKVAYAVGWGSLVGLQPSIHIVTTDGGVNWNYLTQTQANRTYDNLYCVYFKDENNGVALGGAAKGTLALKTTDGGQNWIPVRFPSGVTIEHISAVGNTVWVTGGGGVIFRTTNFGDNWELLTPIPSVNLYDVQYLTGGIIYAGGFDGLFLKSSNSGNNWIANYVTSGLVTTNVQDIHFINENVGYATQSYGLLSKTTDGGKSWFASIPDTNNASTVIYGVNFVNENLGFAVGKIANGLDMIYKTINGGQKWDMKMNLISGSFRHIDFYNENIGVAVGEKLKAMFTTDGGNTWNNSTFVSLPPGTTTPNLRKVEFRDANNVTAVGDAIILNSTDAGANWNYAPVDNLVETLTGLSFSDQLNGIAVGSKTSTPKSVTILKTTDGAQTWTNITNTDMFLATDVINSVSLNSNYIWICGATSNIFTNEPVTSVFDEENQPEEYYLAQNYPNPFNPATKITFKLEKSSFVSLKIFDVLGREIKTLVNEYRLAGNHELVFDASNLSSGIYLYVLNSTDYSIAKKMTLMK